MRKQTEARKLSNRYLDKTLTVWKGQEPYWGKCLGAVPRTDPLNPGQCVSVQVALEIRGRVFNFDLEPDAIVEVGRY